MKDERGHYYTPSLQHSEVRMYVRANNDDIEFRLYNPKEPIIWEKHKWMPYSAIEQAAAMFRERGTDRNPLALYDMDIAKKLLQEG
ncbi:hypothetical protein SYK_28380 [Pseudodesulfovibrio nedwellii]|uniref:Uncharacterized protein n=1 Tax=Pseudodesulfovibrio nedwellii TaxID=2973072 RepID=A0ABN6S8F5_9BACT|nr:MULTISPECIES: hypothetical protein [Pseudodesulfovibrio]BDQ38478.1 hypothetical protein SYK_28380 [Pseudodesulfovibrio nedwellii]